jgi:hypothetical protein
MYVCMYRRIFNFISPRLLFQLARNGSAYTGRLIKENWSLPLLKNAGCVIGKKSYADIGISGIWVLSFLNIWTGTGGVGSSSAVLCF